MWISCQKTSLNVASKTPKAPHAVEPTDEAVQAISSHDYDSVCFHVQYFDGLVSDGLTSLLGVLLGTDMYRCKAV